MKIFLAGHRGMVGSAILRQLEARDKDQIITRTSSELDLCDQSSVRDFMQSEKPDAVILAAALVGGIMANNTYPADFIYNNLLIQANVIGQAHEADVQKLLFLGSSCIYPRDVEQPMAENALMTGVLEPTNEPYAVAKIAGIKMCESFNRQYGRDYRSVMPTNLYGPGDNFHPEKSHVLPAMIRRFHEAKLNGLKSVVIWGTGAPLREFLHVDDMAEASLFVMDLPNDIYERETEEMLSHINVGFGSDISIKQLAELVREVVGYEGEIEFDDSKPDGTPRKLMNSERLARLGWKANTALREGIESTYSWYQDHIDDFRSK